MDVALCDAWHCRRLLVLRWRRRVEVREALRCSGLVPRCFLAWNNLARLEAEEAERRYFQMYSWTMWRPNFWDDSDP